MMSIGRIARWAICGLLSSGCTGTETGNPGSSMAAMRLAMTSSTPSAVSVGTPGGAVVVSEVWMSVQAVDLAACAADGGLPGVRSQAVVELVTERHAFEADTGAFCGARIALVDAQSAPPGAPAELVGSAIVLRGTLADTTPILVATALPLTLEATGAMSFDVHDGESLLSAFDVTSWLAGIDFATLAPEPDGTVRIVESTHPALVDTFVANLANGFALYRDSDADGVLDADEHTALTDHSSAIH